MEKSIVRIIISVALGILVLILSYLIYESIAAPVRFQKKMEKREKVAIQRLKDIREAQVAYKNKYDKYADNFDSLIHFLKNDSIMYIDKVGDDFDTIARNSGDRNLWRRDTLFVPALEAIEYYQIDSLRDPIKEPFNVDSMAYIPFSGGKKFEIGAREVTTGSGLKVWVFEAFGKYEYLLRGLDIAIYVDMEDGMRVGSLDEPNNNAGNWE